MLRGTFERSVPLLVNPYFATGEANNANSTQSLAPLLYHTLFPDVPQYKCATQGTTSNETRPGPPKNL